MQRLLLLAVFFISSQLIIAQKSTEEKAIKQVIATFFEGLQNGDASVIEKTLHNDITIQTTGNTPNGQSFVRAETRAKLLSSVAAKKPEDVYLEKLLSYDIKVDGNLASVWTPYEFYYNGNFSHCGANSFQLYKNNGNWQIIFLMDMRRKTNCTPQTPKK